MSSNNFPRLSSTIRAEAMQPAIAAVEVRPQHRMGRGVTSGVIQQLKRTTTTDVRISSLKILCLTLLEQIESLEMEADGDSAEGLDIHSEIRLFEAQLIKNALIKTGGRQRQAARVLNMKVSTLNAKIKRYKITIEEALNCSPRLVIEKSGRVS